LGWFKKKKNKKKKRRDEAVAEPSSPEESNEPPPLANEQTVAGETNDTQSREIEDDLSEDEQLEETAASPQEEIEPEELQTATAEDLTEEIVTEAPHDPEQEKVGYFKRLRKRLSKTRKSFSGGFDRVFAGKKKIDDDVLEELEELLITSDLGVQTTMVLIERLSKAKVADVSEVKQILKDEILSILGSHAPEPMQAQANPHVVLVVGVNGVGKTTTIGKIAASARASGKKVLIGAADTFRAAAIEQLAIWAERADAEFVKHRANADPAAVAFDAVAAASARGCDIVLIDTAGRLHTKSNLMEELKKIKRTVSKQLEGAPHEILLVLDATTGQNALSQAKQFDEALNLTGLALTKLDGTAKGGIVISICSSLNIPLQYIGVGEQIDDLRRFDAEQFIEALF
jgi:fused signal recognition particle receptor